MPQWTTADGPHKRCFFQHACYPGHHTPEHLSPKLQCHKECMTQCVPDCRARVNPPSETECTNECTTHCTDECAVPTVGLTPPSWLDQSLLNGLLLAADGTNRPVFWPSGDLCTYEGPCSNSHGKPRPSTNTDGSPRLDTFVCKSHSECSSGLCIKADDIPGAANVKLCVPFATCQRPCKELGEELTPETTAVLDIGRLVEPVLMVLSFLHASRYRVSS